MRLYLDWQLGKQIFFKRRLVDSLFVAADTHFIVFASIIKVVCPALLCGMRHKTMAAFGAPDKAGEKPSML